jgi:hypothetical protein
LGSSIPARHISKTRMEVSKMELAIALVIAFPVSLTITRIVMAVAARANRAAERWEHYCVMKKLK